MLNLSETENSPRILLVDDDKDHLMLFKLVLEDGGYSVDTYTDPVKALSKFRPDYYHLAVLDNLMPVLNGLELYRRIREIDPKIMCSILTANHEKFIEDEDKPERPENLRIIRKPIGNKELLMNIREQVPIESFRYTTLSSKAIGQGKESLITLIKSSKGKGWFVWDVDEGFKSQEKELQSLVDEYNRQKNLLELQELVEQAQYEESFHA